VYHRNHGIINFIDRYIVKQVEEAVKRGYALQQVGKAAWRGCKATRETGKRAEKAKEGAEYTQGEGTQPPSLPLSLSQEV
jgi:hypothetical protein